MIELRRDYVVCLWHKTARTYGAAGKYVDEGTLEAFKVLHMPRPRFAFALPQRRTCVHRVLEFPFPVLRAPQLACCRSGWMMCLWHANVYVCCIRILACCRC